MARISFDGSPRNESDPYGTTLDLGNGITQTMAPGYTINDLTNPTVKQPAMPTMAMPSDTRAPNSRVDTNPTPQTDTRTPTYGGGGDDSMLSLLQSGMDPQAAINLFNQTNKRGYGNEAVYYNDNRGITIGLPTGYYALTPNGWTWTVRGPEGPAAPVTQGTGGGLSGTPGPNPGGYDDPSSMLFLNEVMNRLNQLKQPQDTTVLDKLRQMALDRVDSLNGAPYTAGEENALVTQMRDPLTLARDTAKKQKAEDLARRGIGPSSGLYASEMGKIDQAYERGMAQGTNQLAVNAVTEKQRRADEQLSILMNLLGTTNTQQDRTDQRAREVLQTAEVFPNFDEKRLQDLLGASNDGASNPGSLLSSIMQLGNLNLNAQNTANANSQASASTWGQILGYLLNNL